MTKNIEFENKNAPTLFRIEWCVFNLIAIISSCFSTDPSRAAISLDKLLCVNFLYLVNLNKQQSQNSIEKKFNVETRLVTSIAY